LPGRVCVDASLAISWVIGERFTPSALASRQQWIEDDIEMIAPPVFRPEVTSALRLAVYRRDVTPENGRRALNNALRWPVFLVEDSDGLQRRAYDIATAFARPRAYDAQYLAVAQSEDCEFWTGDERLINSLGGRLGWAHWIGNYQSG